MPRARCCTSARRSGCDSRVRSYFADRFRRPARKNQLLQRLIADVETIVVPSEAQSLILENNLIKEYRPRFNVRLKDDKSYPSIAVTLERAVPPGAGHPPAEHPGRPLLRALHRRRPAAADARHHPPALHRAQLPRRPAARSAGSGPASTTTSAGARRRAWAGRTRPTTGGWWTTWSSSSRAGPATCGTGSARPMLAASGREDYERARELRDALRWLERLEEPVGGRGDRHRRRGRDRLRPRRRRRRRRADPGARGRGWWAASTGSSRASRRRRTPRS